MQTAECRGSAAAGVWTWTRGLARDRFWIPEEAPRPGPGVDKTRKDARQRCRVGPLLVDLFLHIRVHLFCLQVSEHMGVEEIEVYQNSEARSVLKPSETHLYIVDMTKKLNRDIYT